jgi:hypothetical protein
MRVAMTITSIILTTPNTYTADIDGTIWSNITPVSRFYAEVEAAIAAGEPVDTLPVLVIPTPDLSFPQLLIGLVAEQWITEADGEAWLTGTLPTAVLEVISSLPTEMQFPAKARALRPSMIVRADPLVAALATYEGKTPEELDEFFLTYSQV